MWARCRGVLVVIALCALTLIDASVASWAQTAPPTDAPTVTATAGDTTVSLSWTAVTGADSYTVTRDGTQVASGVTALSYSDTGLVDGTSYTYTVTAVNSGGSGPASTAVSATPVAPAPAPSPSPLWVTTCPTPSPSSSGGSTSSPSCPPTVVTLDAGQWQPSLWLACTALLMSVATFVYTYSTRFRRLVR